MTSATGVGLSVAGVSGSWESGAEMHGGLSLGASALVSVNSGCVPSALPARGVPGDAGHGGGVKDLSFCLPQNVMPGTDEGTSAISAKSTFLRLKQKIARISATLVAINDLPSIGSAGVAHQEELGTQLVELRQHLICDDRLKSLQIRVSTLAAKIQDAEKELQQWKVDFETSKEELEKLMKERRCAEAQRLGSIPLTPTVLLQQALLALECGQSLGQDWHQSAVALVGAPPGQAQPIQTKEGLAPWSHSSTSASDKRPRVSCAGLALGGA